MLGLMEGEWSCYGGGQFKRGRMFVTEAACLMEGDWRGMLERWSVQWR